MRDIKQRPDTLFFSGFQKVMPQTKWLRFFQLFQAQWARQSSHHIDFRFRVDVIQINQI